jgi:hypothetical protein
LPSSIANATSELVRAWFHPALVALFGLAVGALWMRWFQVLRERSLARARNLRGRRGEERAVQLLTAAGYAIVARQQRTSYTLRSGANEVRVGLSFDFVVEKDGRQCVAEVKTGALGTQLKHAETRRQLLEYQLASGASEVLLVDPEREHISQVSFPLGSIAAAATADESAPEPTAHAWPLIVCIAFCALSVYLWTR